MRVIKINRLAVSNIVLIIKTVLSQALLLALFLSVSFFAFNVTIDEAVQLVDPSFMDSVENLFSSILSVDFNIHAFMNAATVLIDEVTEQIQANTAIFEKLFDVVFGTVIVACLIYALWKIINGLLDLPVVLSLNDYMSTGRRKPYLWRVAKSLGKSFVFQLLYTLITILVDICIFYCVVGMYLILLFPMGLPGIIIVALFGVTLYSLRQTVFAFWLPAMAVEDMKVVAGLKQGLKLITDKFWSVFLYSFALITFCLALGICAIVFLGGYVGLALTLIVIMVGFFNIRCMNLVAYYDVLNKPYFMKKLDLVVTDGKQ